MRRISITRLNSHMSAFGNKIVIGLRRGVRAPLKKTGMAIITEYNKNPLMRNKIAGKIVKSGTDKISFDVSFKGPE